MEKIGLIGHGAIGTAIVEAWGEQLEGRLQLAAVLVRPGQVDAVSSKVNGQATVVSSLPALLETGPSVVVEAAGHGAVAECGEQILAAGCEFHILSIGALADDALRLRLKDAAGRGGGRIIIPTGALAGLDGLLSMRAAGLISVKYTCTKPVKAWRGTVAEDSIRLDEIRSPQIIFSGTAREAAEAYPRNANLAAAVALAGMGFDQTEVELVADPLATNNIARIEAECASDKLDVALTGAGFAENPKTSQITAMSAIATLRERTELIAFG